MSYLVVAPLGASPTVDPAPRKWRQWLASRNRLAFAAAATTATTVLSSGLMLGFDDASPVVWLASVAPVAELAVDCDRKPHRATREQCRWLISQRMAVLHEAPGPRISHR